ncbi:hypothetical protein [Streptomyces rimosus]|uniref:hypothetical protein n=1 Tax=Streptomyces rimosus TaxID=1927 RepID=UPI0004BFF62C|nr:hypothetical protein [Streptomyces rimosus]
MSESEQSGREHDSEKRAADRDPLAWAAEVTAGGENPTDGVRITSFDSPAIPSSRLGRMESPVEMYTVMKPVPNPLPAPADAEEWLKSFAPDAPRTPRAHGMRRGETTDSSAGRELALLWAKFCPGVVEHANAKTPPGKTPPPSADQAARWKEAVARAADPGTLAMLEVEYTAALHHLAPDQPRPLAVDTDPQGTPAEWPGGPGLDLCRTCDAPADEPSTQCTNPFNHHGTAQ